MFNPKALIRDASQVHRNLREMEDGRLVTVKGCKIYIPCRFDERGLASVSSEVHIIGIYAITVNDLHYGVSLVNAMIHIEPTSTRKVVVDEEEYFEFYFEPGATVMVDTNLVKKDTLTYLIYDEIISKGHVPWYLGYPELGKLFDTAKYHAGADIGQNQDATELMASLIARDPSNRQKYYRQAIQSYKDLETNPPVFTPMRSVAYAATDTVTKLGGSHFNEGVLGALVNPAERTERIEEILRR